MNPLAILQGIKSLGGFLVNYWKPILFFAMIVLIGFLYMQLRATSKDLAAYKDKLNEANSTIVTLKEQAILISQVTTEERAKSEARIIKVNGLQKGLYNVQQVQCGVDPAISDLLNSMRTQH